MARFSAGESGGGIDQGLCELPLVLRREANDLDLLERSLRIVIGGALLILGACHVLAHGIDGKDRRNAAYAALRPISLLRRRHRLGQEAAGLAGP